MDAAFQRGQRDLRVRVRRSGDVDEVELGLRGETLILWSQFDSGNYRYLMEYRFSDEGVITCRLGATAGNLYDRKGPAPVGPGRFDLTTYRIVSDDSDVRIHARSSVHPIEGRATEVRGTLDVDVADSEVTGLHGGRIEVPVRSLRSGNPLEDSELQRRVDARRFPTIVGEVRNAAMLDGPGRFRVDGDLTFHGVTEAVNDEVHIAIEGDRIVLEGEHVFDVRRFGVTPPRILMLRVHPEVRVDIRLVAEPAFASG